MTADQRISGDDIFGYCEIGPVSQRDPFGPWFHRRYNYAGELVESRVNPPILRVYYDEPLRRWWEFWK